jgi:hypothetical protein
VGRQNKKSYAGTNAKISDLRKKANKDERREVKQYLSEGRYEGLLKQKKFTSNQIEWED